MILALLLLTVAIATGLAALKSKRSSRVLYIVATVVLLLMGSGAPANWLLENLQEGIEARNEQWGTANAMNEFVAQRSFNDPDKGLFVAPPV